jgi:hypothetical protein
VSTVEIGAIMRLPILLPLAFTASLLSACVTDPTSGYKPRSDEIAEIKGVYALDNGSTLRISTERRKLYVEFGQRGKAEMVPVAENLYVAPDLHMTMEYRSSGFGDQIVLTYPVDQDAASGKMARLVTNR